MGRVPLHPGQHRRRPCPRAPPLREPIEHIFGRDTVTIEAGSSPAPSLGLRLDMERLITDLDTAVTLRLARDDRQLTMQSYIDLLDRLPACMKTRNRATLLDR